MHNTNELMMLVPPVDEVSADLLQPVCNTSQERKGQKRQRNVSDWKQNVHKRLRNSGMEYTRSNGQISERRQMMYYQCRQCVNKCKDRLSEDERHRIFTARVYAMVLCPVSYTHLTLPTKRIV